MWVGLNCFEEILMKTILNATWQMDTKNLVKLPSPLVGAFVKQMIIITA